MSGHDQALRIVIGAGGYNNNPGNFPDEAYQAQVRVGGPGPADHPASTQYIVHTCKTLTAMFEAAVAQYQPGICVPSLQIRVTSGV